MLSRLKISNFALVEDVELAFDRGMSVLTGETGAGKSVIVAALGMVLGDRADREHIRHGATKAAVEATFLVSHLPHGYRNDYRDYFKGNSFTILRRISRDGSSRVKINGAVSSLSRLKELTSPLAEILGQHASRLLLDENNHLLFLDRFALLESDREMTAELFARWENARVELRRVKNRREELIRERELLQFQQQEIENAQVRIGEEKELIDERRILDSSRTLTQSAASIQSIIDGEQHSLLDSLRETRRELEKMAAIDSTLRSQVEQLTELDYELEDMRRFVEQYGSSVPNDPARLEAINERLDELYELKRKYGGSEEVVVQTLASIKSKLRDRPDTDSLISTLAEEEKQCRKAYTEKALALSEVRDKAAAYLEKLVIKELSDLAIDSGNFRFEFVHEDDPDGVETNGRTVRPYPHGLENGRFLFSANPGEPLKSLARTASGGEISRVLLALKAAEKKNNILSHALLVFDEVDAGIGGKTATEVGKKLKRISEDCQVLVITHLHQIARQADHHYLAQKARSDSKRVTIDVTRLDRPGIAAELERMVALPEEAWTGN